MQIFDSLINDFERALLNLDENQAKIILEKSLQNNPLITALSKIVTISLERIGNGWEKGNYSLSQVYMSGLICESLIDGVLPPNSPSRKQQPKTAIGVFEDFHLLGKRIVYSSLRATGLELMDLGGGLTLKQTVELVEKNQIRILLLSVLMLPSALRIKELVRELEGSGVIIVAGGAPFRFDPLLADEIGIYASGKDSAEAIDIMHKLMEGVQ